jgi:Domain of unknown function (DUF5063)
VAEELNVSDPRIVSFLSTARGFCKHIEKGDWQNKDIFIEAINKDLIRLYSCGLDMPLVNLTRFYADTLELDEEVINIAKRNIENNTPFQYYWTVLEPLELTMSSTGTGDLIDDLLDIYKDLKFGLAYFDDVEDFQELSIWTLKTTFLNHWSDHCVNAFQVVHNYLSNKD